MMPAFDLSQHPFFEPWSDPVTGVCSYLLRERVAPVQQSFYFVNPSISGNEKWLWFYCAFPPTPYRSLGVVSLDAANPFIRHFPQSAFTSESPLVSPEGDSVYFCSGSRVLRIDVEGHTEEICALDDKWINGRLLTRMATHLTLSANKRTLLLDGQIGNHWFIALGDIVSGEVTIIKEFGRHYNHAQFSPHEDQLFSLAQDWWKDPITGQFFDFDNRIWLMDIENRIFEPIQPHEYASNSRSAHEWWSKDGHLCWVNYEQGVYEFSLENQTAVHLWKKPLCHAHCDTSRRYWCADESPYKWNEKPCEVLFFDRETEKETAIVSAMPPPPILRSVYHIDPHPQFSPHDSFVVYTSTVNDQIDVALTPTSQFCSR